MTLAADVQVSLRGVVPTLESILDGFESAM